MSQLAEHIAYELCSLYSRVEDRLGSPYGYSGMTKEEHLVCAQQFLEATVGELEASEILDTVPPELLVQVLDILEDENFHTLHRAVEVLKGKITIESILPYYTN